MGVGAYVYCRCWQDGLALPPPAGPIGFDEDGLLGLLTPEAADDAAVENWLRHGCAHADMQFACEDLGSWSGVRHFQQALRAAGGAHFPTLLEHLPRTNDGYLHAAAVPGVQVELEYFENQAELPDEAVLVDETTGDALFAYIESYRGVFSWGRYLMGIDPAGFFVVDNRADPPVTLFQANRFEQRVRPAGELELTADGQSVRLVTTPIANSLPVPPRRMAVRVRARSAADFAGHLAALRRLCAASLATGNSVNWV